MNKIEIATRIAWSFLGTPYSWGGDDPINGFDCSGFVIEVLKSVGLFPRGQDMTAQGLSELYPRCEDTKEGCLVFWRSSTDENRIVHVEYCLDEVLSIGASGGGSKTMTMQDAIEQNAYIKIRPFRSRSHIYGFVDPFKGER